ncbi:hypothetical protein D5S18_07080 [Nocardia panacis]|uniref:Uncharacterized protein n=1 Tax=Nocardia panacis TaxID=2340916 RepID=A0A3A4KQP1_9NOCA|nr:hypothetical protein D5S18_07080 [Nocardia panacis]
MGNGARRGANGGCPQLTEDCATRARIGDLRERRAGRAGRGRGTHTRAPPGRNDCGTPIDLSGCTASQWPPPARRGSTAAPPPAPSLGKESVRFEYWSATTEKPHSPCRNCRNYLEDAVSEVQPESTRIGADWWSVIIGGVVTLLAIFDALPRIPW